MKGLLKRIAAKLPAKLQQKLRKAHLQRQFRHNTYADEPEPEFHQLPRWVSPGDWVIDVGANIGDYTRRLSELVGPNGRVFAFEPVPETFEILAANVASVPLRNITLFNAAASDRAASFGMSVPILSSGLRNYYTAAISEQASDLAVFGYPLDAIRAETRIALVKIDAEGHEHSVLLGMRGIMERDHPILIVECPTPETLALVAGFGYQTTRYANSPNIVFWTVKKS
jgi:FkbM family methyltransferase